MKLQRAGGGAKARWPARGGGVAHSPGRPGAVAPGPRGDARRPGPRGDRARAQGRATRRVPEAGGEGEGRRKEPGQELTSCSAQRPMSEQRPVQQPMVPAASERRAPPEVWVVRRRRLPTPERPPPGALWPARPGLARPAAAALFSRGRARAPPLLVSRAGRGQCGAHDPSVWLGSLRPAGQVCFLGRGSRAGGEGADRREGGYRW